MLLGEADNLICQSISLKRASYLLEIFFEFANPNVVCTLFKPKYVNITDKRISFLMRNSLVAEVVT